MAASFHFSNASWILTSSLALSAMLIASCTSSPEVESGTIVCDSPSQAGGFIGLFSLHVGQLAMPLGTSDQVDLAYYFDNDDCRDGALLGQDNHSGSLIPIGHYEWQDLSGLEPPTQPHEKIVAITPLTKEAEGMAFWLRSGSGNFALARIVAIQEASYSDLHSGLKPALELEWMWARTLAESGDESQQRGR